MVDTNELESFLNERSAKDGDMCVIVADGVIELKTDANSGRKYRTITFPVEVEGRPLSWSPDKDAIAVFQAKWGTDSIKWIGHKFTLKFYPKMVFGKKKVGILPVLIE